MVVHVCKSHILSSLHLTNKVSLFLLISHQFSRTMKVINAILLLSAVLGLTAAEIKCHTAVDSKTTTSCSEDSNCKMVILN